MVTQLIDLPIRGGPGPIIPQKNFSSSGRYRGFGNPNGVIPAAIGATYLDQTDGDIWSKLTDDLQKTGWVIDADSESGIISEGSETSRTSAVRWAEIGNIKDFGAVADGSTDALASIVAALAEWDTIRIDGGSFTVSANLTIAATKTLIFSNGGKLKPASGTKITINAEIQAGRFEIFDYSAGGKVCLGPYSKTGYLFPEWYGAASDNSTNNDTPFARMFDSSFVAGQENIQKVLLNHGYYNFIVGFTVPTRAVLIGSPVGKTRLQYAPTVSGRLVTLPEDGDSIEFRDIQFNVNTFTATVRTTAIGNSSSAHENASIGIRNCTFSAFNQYAIYLAGTQYLTVSDCTFLTITNHSDIGGTGAAQATCVYAASFLNQAFLGNSIKCLSCDQFIHGASVASLTITGSSFEQGDDDYDSVTLTEDFMCLVGATNNRSCQSIRILNNYFEGVRTAAGKGLFGISNGTNFDFSANNITGQRPGDEICHAQIFVRVGASTLSGNVCRNHFNGSPASGWVSVIDAESTHPPICNDNIYRDNSNNDITDDITNTQIALSHKNTEYRTAFLNHLIIPLFHRTYDDLTTTITRNVSVTHALKTLAGAAGMGAGINFTGTNSVAGTEKAMADISSVWTVATNGAEYADTVIRTMTNGTVATAFTVQGAGGVAVRGNVQPTRQTTATSLTATRLSGMITVTATGQTITLDPSASFPDAATLTIKLRIGGAGTCTVARGGADLIDGATTYSLSADYKYVTLRLDKTNTCWDIIASN